MEQFQLEQQIERGELFTHTVLSQHAAHMNEIESFLFGLIDTLSENGVISSEDLAKSVKAVRQEMEEKGEVATPAIALRVDSVKSDGEENKNVEEFTPVNCEERLHICQAACCKLTFALSATEIESGTIKWDLGRPYFIRQQTNGYCAHNHSAKRGCNIYSDRPSVCKKYSCANDERIWKDFENMVLNEQWIEEHLSGSKPHLMGVQMTPRRLTEPKRTE